MIPAPATSRVDHDSRLPYLDSLRGLAILLVVAIHARSNAQLGPTAEEISFALTEIAVPIFFLCDGFLFVHRRRRVSSFDYKSYVAASARRLLVPWGVFSALYVALRAVFEAAGFLSERVVLGRSAAVVLLDVYGSPVAPQMYFLLSLFLIRATSGVLRHLATLPSFLVWIVFAAYVALFQLRLGESLKVPLPRDLDPIRHAFWGLQFYLLGILLARHHTAIARVIPLLASVAVGAFGLAVIAWGARSVPVVFSGLMASYLLLWLATPRVNLLSRIGRESMGIYLLHAPVLLKGVWIVVASLPTQPLAAYVTVIAATFSAAYVAARLIKRVPRGGVIFGEFPSEP